MKYIKKAFFLLFSLWLFLRPVCIVSAEEVHEEAEEENEEEQTEETGETEETEDFGSHMYLYEDTPEWPAAPEIASEGAILMDADTGVILYGKNMEKPQYPASITKIMTCLLAAENCEMDEMVTFSHEAVFGIDRGSSNVGMDEGQSITMEEAIYCIMLASANEVAAAVAEHVSGSIDKFAELMNERAAELGCTHTHFVNANGLPDEEHYTSPRDMALISQEFNRSDILRKIAGTALYQVEATATQPDSFPMPNHHQMYPEKEYAYEYVTWGKTGYTIAAKGTLVTCAERNGLNLICVVMKADPPGHYRDTRALLDYGFSNFHYENPSRQEESFQVDTDRAVFGMEQLFAIDPGDQVLIPDTLQFSDLDRQLDLTEDDPDTAGVLTYSLRGHYLGSAWLKSASSRRTTFEFGGDRDDVIYVNIREILQIVVLIVVPLILLGIGIYVLKNYNFPGRRRRLIKRKNSRYHSEFDHFDF